MSENGFRNNFFSSDYLTPNESALHIGQPILYTKVVSRSLQSLMCFKTEPSPESDFDSETKSEYMATARSLLSFVFSSNVSASLLVNTMYELRILAYCGSCSTRMDRRWVRSGCLTTLSPVVPLMSGQPYQCAWDCCCWQLGRTKNGGHTVLWSVRQYSLSCISTSLLTKKMPACLFQCTANSLLGAPVDTFFCSCIVWVIRRSHHARGL